MYKPVSSKVNNSEAYIVCRGFRGMPDGVRSALLKFVCTDVYEKHAMLPLAIMPASFVKSAKGCGQFFAERTRAAIEDTLSKREMHPGQLKAVREVQDFLATQWMKKFRVTKLAAELRLSPVRPLGYMLAQCTCASNPAGTNDIISPQLAANLVHAWLAVNLQLSAQRVC